MRSTNVFAPVVCSFSFVLALAALPACGASPREESVSVDESALLDAPVDPKHKFDVGVCGGPLTDAGTCAKDKCSGTLVAPNVVLTAQHCIYGIDYANAWCDSTFTDGQLYDTTVRVTTSPSTIVGQPKWYDVSEVHVPGKNLCHDDIALLVLKSHVPLNEASPVPMSLFRDVAKNEPNEVAIVGRGVIADTMDLTTGAETKVDGDLTRRVLEHVPFVCATDTTATCDVVDYSSPPTNVFNSPSPYFVIKGVVASGDSGAAVFDQKTFGLIPSVIGVASAGTWGADGTPNFALISRIDIHRSFIEKTMLKALFQ